MPSEPQATEHHRRWEFLDVVRGLAALLVVLQHSPVRTGKQHLSYGLAGVVAFFLVSGFVIPVSLERYGYLLRFWTGRFLRIAPLYYVCAAVITYLAVHRYGVRFTSHVHWGRYVLANALLVQHAFHVPFAVDVSWTLTYEVVFYIVCSLLFVAGVQSRSTLWLWSGIVLSLLAAGLYRAVSHHALAATALGLVVTALYGTVVFRYFQDEVSRAAVLWPLPALFALIGIMAHIRGAASVGGVEDGTYAGGTTSTLLSWALGFAVFGAAFLLRGKHFPAVLLWFGSISYSLYLVHGSLRLVWPFPLNSGLTGYPLLVAIAVPLSWATHALIEVPANRLQHRLFPHRVIPLRVAAVEEGTAHV